MKRLYKSRTDKVISGVCGGIAKYFGVDPTLIRVAWVISLLLGGIGFFGYIVAMIIIPAEPQSFEAKKKFDVFEENSNDSFADRFGSDFLNIDKAKIKKSLPIIAGSILIGFGFVILGSSLGIFSFRTIGRFIVPALIIGVGLYFVLKSKK